MVKMNSDDEQKNGDESFLNKDYFNFDSDYYLNSVSELDEPFPLAESSPLASQSMVIRRENYEDALELGKQNVQLKTKLQMTEAEISRLKHEKEKEMECNLQLSELQQQMRELEKKVEQQKNVAYRMVRSSIPIPTEANKVCEFVRESVRMFAEHKTS